MRSRRRGRRSHAASWPRYLCYSVTIVLFALIFLIPALYVFGAIGMPTTEALSSMDLSFIFPALAISYLFIKGRRPGQIIPELGLSRKGINPRNIAYGIFLFMVVLAFGAAISLFSYATGIPLPTNVQTVLNGLPLYFLIFTFLIAPINEEILFRGLMVPRIGIVLSALIFAALHASYLSVSEFAAALLFGLIAGYAFKRTGSLYTSIVGHMLVNLLAILSFLSIGGMLIHI